MISFFVYKKVAFVGYNKCTDKKKYRTALPLRPVLFLLLACVCKTDGALGLSYVCAPASHVVALVIVHARCSSLFGEVPLGVRSTVAFESRGHQHQPLPHPVTNVSDALVFMRSRVDNHARGEPPRPLDSSFLSRGRGWLSHVCEPRWCYRWFERHSHRTVIIAVNPSCRSACQSITR